MIIKCGLDTIRQTYFRDHIPGEILEYKVQGLKMKVGSRDLLAKRRQKFSHLALHATSDILSDKNAEYVSKSGN